MTVGGGERGWVGPLESSKENVYYSDFVYGDFSKHKTKYIEINIGLKTYEPWGGEKLQIMETSLKDRNYRSGIQVRSVTSTNQTKAPCVGHIPSASFPAQDKVLFCISLSLSLILPASLPAPKLSTLQSHTAVGKAAA